MPIFKLQCTIAADNLFPVDQIVITPHFNVSVPGADADQLCEDLATALDTYLIDNRQIVVKAYDAQGTPPVYPVGEATRNVGLAPASSGVREVAICLSYYSEFNRPRYRGRLYMPTGILQIGTGSPRPSVAQQQRVADFVPILTGLGGVDVDWVVFSRRDNVARSVSNWWVDDAWDIQRSRGLRPTNRIMGSVSE